MGVIAYLPAVLGLIFAIIGLAKSDNYRTQKSVAIVGIILGALALIVAGGHFLVDSATVLAKAAGVSDWVIAVTIVAAGTSAQDGPANDSGLQPRAARYGRRPRTYGSSGAKSQ